MYARMICLLAASLMASPAVAQLKLAAGGPEASPYTLTTPDGTGLALVALEAKAVVDGPLAFTELRLTFENPHPRTIEGHFKIVMPEGAAISRFAMKIRGAWMEGEVVEKQAARRAYEDALHRRQDPALLEQDSGNVFRARIFPIPANGQKEIIISWSHELRTAGEAYRLPLKGLPKVTRLKLTALTATATAQGPRSSLGGTTSRYQVSEVIKRDFTPEQDWVIFGGKIPANGDALRVENLAVARFMMPGATAPLNIPAATLLFDTSASRAIGYADRVAAFQTLVQRLETMGVTEVRIVAFDQVTQEIYQGHPRGFDDKAAKSLLDREALGASDLSVGLAAVRSWTKGDHRLIIFSDGMLTAGERDREALKALIKGLSAQSVSRVDVVVDTTARDAGLLKALVDADLPHAGKVVEGRAPLGAQLRVLSHETLPPTQVAVDGAKWVQPSTLRGVQAGDTVLVFADLPAGQPLEISLGRIGVGTTVIQPAVRPADKALLERAWIAARIQRLENMRSHGDPDMKAAFKHQILALSVRHRVLSPYTALVVLETERDYRRFNIDRKALADILVVGATGVERMHREALANQLPPPPPPPPIVRPRPRPQKRATRTRGRRTGAITKGSGGLDDLMSAVDTEREGDRGEALVTETAAASAPVMMAKSDSARAPAATPSVAGSSKKRGRMARPSADAPLAEAADARERKPMGRRTVNRIAVDSTRRPQPFPEHRPPPPPARRPQQIAKPTGEVEGRREYNKIQRGAAALTDRMAKIDRHLRKGRKIKALRAAIAWHSDAPMDLVALVALGRALDANGNKTDAARAFGSVLDLYPSRADMRRFAGNWLEKLGPTGLELAADTYRVAMAQRPDHPSIYHLLSMVLVRLGRYEEALDVALTGIGARRVTNRFGGVDRVLQEDAQLIAAAWLAADDSKRTIIEGKLAPHRLKIDEAKSMRFVLTWETDSNDVDFHIFDKRYNHAYYSRKQLHSGGDLYHDITTGYGPECFTIFEPNAFPYRLKAHYYRKGPMGHGAGKLQVIRHDGKGGLGFEERPFVIMVDGAYVDLGKVKKGVAKPWKQAPKAIAR